MAGADGSRVGSCAFVRQKGGGTLNKMGEVWRSAALLSEPSIGKQNEEDFLLFQLGRTTTMYLMYISVPRAGSENPKTRSRMADVS